MSQLKNVFQTFKNILNVLHAAAHKLVTIVHHLMMLSDDLESDSCKHTDTKKGGN